MASVITRLIIISFGGFCLATNVTVTLTVKHHMVGDKDFFFICLSDSVPQGCSVEFLKNNQTVDTLRRYSDDHCYHNTKGNCTEDDCSCSSDCMNFTLKYPETEIRAGDMFSCKMRIQDDGTGVVLISSKETTVTQSGVHNSTIKESSDNTGVVLISSKETTVTQSGVHNSTIKASSDNTGLIAGIVVACLCIVILAIVIVVAVFLKMGKKIIYKVVDTAINI